MVANQEQEPRLIDVSHVVHDGMITYKGLPAPIICDFLSREASRDHYAEGTEFHIGRIDMVANTGTYIDAPFHRYAHGKDISQLPLSSLANLEGVVVRVDSSHGKSIDVSEFENINVRAKAVLVHTGWDVHWGSDQYFEGHPFLTREAAQYLVEKEVKLVGIDSLNIDDTSDGHRPVHTILLGAEIPIIEHLCNLGSLPECDFKFFAVPVKVKDFGTFPVRAFGIINESE
jgi:kynurenine formamidase